MRTGETLATLLGAIVAVHSLIYRPVREDRRLEGDGGSWSEAWASLSAAAPHHARECATPQQPPQQQSSADGADALGDADLPAELSIRL